ncbi:MAG: hypothetical protein NC222_06510 [Staphylococcus sp.]|nr:hypothetical protein [Staphylococcus sp.]
MNQTLQEILAKNNVTTQVKTAGSEDVKETNTVSITKQEQKAAISDNKVDNKMENTNKNVQEQKKSILMSSDDTEHLDIKKFQGEVKETSWFKLEEDIYEAKCVKIDNIMGQDFNGNPEEKFCWYFEVSKDVNGDPLEKPVTLRYYTRLAFGEKSNNYKIYSAFFGEPAQGSTINILECIGKECRLNVVDNKKGDKVYSKIKDILKSRKK